MSQPFHIEKKDAGSLARAGVIRTPHGDIQTPAFIPVGTKATVKALAPEQVAATGAQAVLSNTYHLYLQPGPELVKAHGGLAKFMGWNGPTFTDSGGFQVFSLGADFGKRRGKFVQKDDAPDVSGADESFAARLAKVDDAGVTFKSHIDGSEHRFTPERSISIQHDIGADIIFAFDECPPADAPETYQREAMARTHRWAAQSLAEHKHLGGAQLLYGIVQGGRNETLRRESAAAIGGMAFDGFGIGGSFDKEDMGHAVRWVNEGLPEDRPRHLLGIGTPEDLPLGVENGADTFDCVTPTRLGRTGSLYTKAGRLNIFNAQYAKDMAPIEEGCDCYTCQRYTRAYLAHLFRAKEMFAATLASIHNIRFLVRLVADMRAAILDGTFSAERFLPPQG